MAILLSFTVLLVDVLGFVGLERGLELGKLGRLILVGGLERARLGLERGLACVLRLGHAAHRLQRDLGVGQILAQTSDLVLAGAGLT